MRKDFVCQDDFSHKIWGVVLVTMEGDCTMNSVFLSRP